MSWGQQEAHESMCTEYSLSLSFAAVHLDNMVCHDLVPYVAIALVDSKLGAEGRNDLFDWLSRQLSGLSSFAEAAQLLKPSLFFNG
ncbi:unnamed protein product [Trifolium pratense]|uniref:Uncharacterized protein n=1 Tax=Trifolium pratense TaxID=57577 RepID=A0ACB0K760_TRIPR|nr:unnamed protein product [Trifolium pratense]